MLHELRRRSNQPLPFLPWCRCGRRRQVRGAGFGDCPERGDLVRSGAGALRYGCHVRVRGGVGKRCICGGLGAAWQSFWLRCLRWLLLILRGEFPLIEEGHLVHIQSAVALCVEGVEERSRRSVETVDAATRTEFLVCNRPGAIAVEDAECRAHAAKLGIGPHSEALQDLAGFGIEFRELDEAGEILVESAPSAHGVPLVVDRLASGLELGPVATIAAILVHGMPPCLQIVGILV
mmetsp:Transcript_86565/g.185462  ORF Transcript_86565/g.185462 Transcript_86565/m.185462 type:complete len:235 (+) Transcript_86565:65-769(+)